MSRKQESVRNRSAAHLVGRDLARVRAVGARGRRSPGIWLIAALIAGLGLAALRIDIFRLRYALAEAVETEQALLEEQSVWTARRATLSDPARLTKLAEERGFVRPTQVIDLDLDPVRVAASPRP